MNRPDEVSALLESSLKQLDIPEDVADRASIQFENVALWLGDPDSPLLEYSPTLYPQGSFRLGTPIRPLDGDEFDIDLVCKLEIAKDRTTQAELKQLVGDQLRRKKEYQPKLKARRRCWTLGFAPDFHLDVLPCIPNGDGSETDILLTDRDLVRWQFSNPIGYSQWFFDQMKQALLEARTALAGRSEAQIEEIPEWRVRTPLQRSVQMLKRHRDVRFKGNPDDRPVSILITTLAAKAYRPQATLAETIIHLVATMPDQIEKRSGQWWVPNPAQPSENFADKWNEEPKRREAFLRWLEIVREDTDSLATAVDEGQARTLLEGNLRIRRAAGGLPGVSFIPVSESITHAKPAPWPDRRRFECSIDASVYRASHVGRALFPLARAVGKNRGIRFRATTDTPAPFEIKWQITNTGTEAKNAGQLRGGFENGEGATGDVRWESTSYKGTHFVQAYVVKNGALVARSDKFSVRIHG